jgi:signal transduction histidine kinase/CheY-like chemotaxis protein
VDNRLTLSDRLMTPVGAFAGIFLPPAAFDDVRDERAFQARRTADAVGHRRAGLLIALLAWSFFLVWDWRSGLPESQRDILPLIIGLRLAGLGILAGCLLLAGLPRFGHGRFAEGVAVLATGVCFALLVAFVLLVPFPVNYLYYYVFLLLLISLFAGAFHRPAQLVVVSLTVLTVAGAVVLAYAALGPNAKAAEFTAASIMDLKGRLLEAARSYYYLDALAYLLVFALTGSAVAVALEKSARQSFLREAALERSKQELEGKTSALVAAERELKEQAERQNVEKSKFLADAAHDLSQPMHAVSLLLDSTREAARRGDIAKVRELTEAAGRAVDSTRASFRALLDISQLESGGVTPRYASFDVQDMVAEVAGTLRPLAEERGVRLEVRMSRGSTVVRSDRVMLSRVVANLANNGIKYADPAKGHRQAVLIGVVAFGSHVRIDVIDNGRGIPRAQWENVFKPFVQLHNPERNRDKGLGLGLSIVHGSIALLAGHRLEMKSEEGRGARFSLEIPRSAETPSAPRPDYLSGQQLQMLQDLFVWYVEDDATVRVATQAVLEGLGVLVESAESLADLEARLADVERPADLVITDYRLPEGHTAADVRMLLGGRLPMLVITGEVQAADWLEDERAVTVVRKPLSVDDLVAALTPLARLALAEPAE